VLQRFQDLSAGDWGGVELGQLVLRKIIKNVATSLVAPDVRFKAGAS